MKVRAVANGNVIEMDDGGAKQLIEAGIYEPVDAAKKSTKVEPLTTKDLVPPPKQAKPAPTKRK